MVGSLYTKWEELIFISALSYSVCQSFKIKEKMFHGVAVLLYLIMNVLTFVEHWNRITFDIFIIQIERLVNWNGVTGDSGV